MSPSNLPAGYIFNAVHDNVIFPVTVPTGGVIKNQKFIVPFPKPSQCYLKLPSQITGQFHCSLFSCLQYGLFHPLALYTFLCPLLLLGQIMTRLKVTWYGRKSDITDIDDSSWINTFRIHLHITLISIASFLFTFPSRICTIIVFLISLYTIYLTITIRYKVREQYHIEEEYPCEDFIMAFMCPCCTVNQLAHEIMDYDIEEAQCCSFN